jgi:23S rRNA (uracil1939-C5)-methyltransferase
VERLGDLEFELSASSFFQTNSAAAEMLITQLRAFAPPAETLLDLYCGVGTLGLALARGCRSLHGIDSVDAAIRDARRNAERNGIENARFETAVAEDWIHRAREIAPDLVIIDPPRAGLHPKACEGLLAVAPPWILYVSCNPSTLARDLAQLVEGGYEPERMRVLDLFPHTPHVETIVRLRRVAAS